MATELNNKIKKITHEESIQQALTIIADLLKNIKYGNIQITIQDGRVVQIDKTEKFRFNDQMLKLTIKTDKQLY
jgi:hypothetical protein